MNEYVTVGSQKLFGLCVKRLLAAGVPQDEAEIIARSLVQADQRGVFSHGSVCVPRYVGLIRDGNMLPKESHRVVRTMGVVEVWDGERSSGQVLGHRAMMRAVEMAQTGGVGVVAVKSANHFGAGAYYAMLAQQATKTRLRRWRAWTSETCLRTAASAAPGNSRSTGSRTSAFHDTRMSRDCSASNRIVFATDKPGRGAGKPSSVADGPPGPSFSGG